jgi:hypothetical protein
LMQKAEIEIKLNKEGRTYPMAQVHTD